MKDAEEKGQKRILVLCVDRDGDLETKAGVKTPVIGREENLNAAVALALKDPEEPDANAMFEAVRIYDRLKNENKTEEVVEMATLSGSEHGGISADRKIVAELNALLGTFSPSETVLVTDGYSDEMVFPLIQSRIPVSSVRRIVVKHSDSIEESAALFWKYIKMITEDSRYSRPLLGVPGVLFLTLGIMALLGLVQYFLVFLVIFFSGILLVKGFGVDRRAKDFYKWVQEYSPPPLRVQISNFSAVVGALCVVLGVYLGVTTAAAEIRMQQDLAGWLSIFPQIAGFFIYGSITLIIVGVCVTLLGRAIRWYMEHDAKLLRNVALIGIVAWSQQIFISTADLLVGVVGPERLIGSILVGILVGVALLIIIFFVHRSARGFFEETAEQVEEFGED